MKKLFKNLAVALFLSQSIVFPICAEKPNIVNPEIQSIRLERIESHSQKAPRASFLDFLMCNYTTEYIEVEIPDFIESLHVTISENDIIIWEGELTQTNNVVRVLSLSECCVISCISVSGEEFQGVLTF